MNRTEAFMQGTRVVPVVVLNNIEQTIPTLEALRRGGIFTAEITFRTACAAEAIRLATEYFSDMKIGAGTVVNLEQAQAALDAGACFVVSPGFSAEVAQFCEMKDAPYIPGCATPTEIMAALACGLTVLKFFPADVYGGLHAIKALAGPFPQVKFLPTGGVNLENIREYLACDKVIAVGGSFMMKGDITENCRKIAEVLL